jgi:hypothetical protein
LKFRLLFALDRQSRHLTSGDVLGGKQEAGMEYILLFATIVASMFIVDYLARERGWNRHRWRVAAATVGPLAIPLLYLVDAASALRKMMNVPRP